MYLDRPLSSPPSRTHTPQPYTDPFADDTAPASTDDPQHESHDIARLRQTHTTQGYRDGITQGKATHLQDGFDEGYTLGGRFGLKIGWIRGAVEGLCFLARDDSAVVKMKRDVESELVLEKIFAREFFDEGGVWRYGIGDEGGVTLDRVVERHPVVERWMVRVKAEAERWGLSVEELAHEEGEEVKDEGGSRVEGFGSLLRVYQGLVTEIWH